ncbi:hypothetical protein [Sphaerisporangium rhizosphaerae]|uniref:DUF3040 domain-containing protein n=1 Tax=Sphaerisporangium rhizosphaerae TaxID=2269375 RepID=A0ABW2PCM8_9ACTN
MTVSQTSRESRGAPSGSTSNGDLIQLDTPVVSLHVHRPHMPRMPRMPGMSRPSGARGQEMNRAVETARTFLPPPERLMYYGGLGLLAALGLVEWPIAVVVGASTAIASRAMRHQGGMGEQGGMMQGRMQGRAAQDTTAEQPATPRATRARASTASGRTATPSTRSRTTGTARTSTRSTRTAAQKSTGGPQPGTA